jgi:hypothetical protein
LIICEEAIEFTAACGVGQGGAELADTVNTAFIADGAGLDE